MLAELEDKLKAFLRPLGPDAARNQRIEFFAEARYASQVWELDTPLPVTRFRDPRDVEALVQAFHEVHERVFAVRDPGSAVECVNWKARLVVHIGRSLKPNGSAAIGGTVHPSHSRPCYFGGTSPVETPVIKPDELGPGLTIPGPAIVEEPTTTLVVFPGMSARVSGAGNYVLKVA